MWNSCITDGYWHCYSHASREDISSYSKDAFKNAEWEARDGINDAIKVMLFNVIKHYSNKLAKRYYGPFNVLERAGKVAYRLTLPDFSKIHPFFHVSLSKPFLGTNQVEVTTLPDEDHEGLLVEQPLPICDNRIMLRKGISASQVLVQWSGSSPEEATWEWLSEFKTTYPSYHLEDKVIFEGEGNVMSGLKPNEEPRSKPIWNKYYVI
ncbi:ty3-gypsy retrotransposon protein [Tanacetum coccineum]